MKGYFKLSKEEYYVLFGNLGKNDPEGYAVCYENERKYVARTIAHDVIEHSIAHRTNRYVTIEEELKAIGAAHFVRSLFDPLEIESLLLDCGRDLNPPPYIPKWKTGIITMDHFDDHPDFQDFYRPNIQTAIDNFEYGYSQKLKQFNDCPHSAYNAFAFIEGNVAGECDLLLGDDQAASYSFYFDTVKQIFRKSRRLYH